MSTVTIPWRLAASLLENLGELNLRMSRREALQWWDSTATSLKLDCKELATLVDEAYEGPSERADRVASERREIAEQVEDDQNIELLRASA